MGLRFKPGESEVYLTRADWLRQTRIILQWWADGKWIPLTRWVVHNLPACQCDYLVTRTKVRKTLVFRFFVCEYSALSGVHSFLTNTQREVTQWLKRSGNAFAVSKRPCSDQRIVITFPCWFADVRNDDHPAATGLHLIRWGSPEFDGNFESTP